jgi:hypothetical protein
VLSLLSACGGFAPVDRPSTPTEGFFQLLPFDTDNASAADTADVVALIAQHPFSISCNGAALHKGYLVINALITPAEIAAAHPVELKTSGNFSVAGAEQYYEGEWATDPTAADHCPDGTDAQLVGPPETPATDASCTHDAP